jgi:P-loop containing dynein motor region D4
MEKLIRVLEEYLADYNATTSSSMNVVFFRDAVEHIVRMCRILRQPRGNALLIGAGGCGKSSMAKFSAHIGGFKCFSIAPGRNYGLTEFREDLKSLYIKVRARQIRRTMATSIELFRHAHTWQCRGILFLRMDSGRSGLKQ